MTIVTLPVKPGPNSMEASLLHMGFVQRGSSSVQVNRPGSRYRITFGFPLMTVDAARAFLSKFKRAKRATLRVKIPLLVPQGAPGNSVVNGSGQTGTTLMVRGFTPGYVIGEDFWFTVVDALGNAYLHSVFTQVTADGSGNATIQIEPPIRAPLLNGSVVEFAAPYMQGFVDGDAFSWSISRDKFVEPSITVEEYR